jgi:hypothetical protein
LPRRNLLLRFVLYPLSEGSESDSVGGGSPGHDVTTLLIIIVSLEEDGVKYAFREIVVLCKDTLGSLLHQQVSEPAPVNHGLHQQYCRGQVHTTT